VSRAHLPRREPPLQFDGAGAVSDDDLDEGPSERSKRARPMPSKQYFSEDEEDDTPYGGDEARGRGSLHTVAYAVGADRPSAHMSARTIGNIAQLAVSDRRPSQHEPARRPRATDSDGAHSPILVYSSSDSARARHRAQDSPVESVYYSAVEGSPRDWRRTLSPDSRRTLSPDNAVGGSPRDSQRTLSHDGNDDHDDNDESHRLSTQGPSMHSMKHIDDDDDDEPQAAQATP